ncbi:3'-5' exonuclease [Kingella kingae]|uniref:3'-5' exonuclease n=3 Tax=Kingella kingae TaxID=504 RepID=UPI000413E591|nr:3'-5' exonuclease [Kingella kingae]MBD3613762.1 3'-5' exonuclease [Kingella kingae]MBD3632013.1 3'-5' exonuclease [Kingella kingae]MBD3659460.1 3'-5' exonuclease [Kingella kingae]MDK4578969.1 3'-5' exonuclease [Kingella kingae]QIF40809.1 3'-5' exonuclease [Kingella kingae]
MCVISQPFLMMMNFSDLAQFFDTLNMPVVILDLETTGGHFVQDRITEVAFLRFWQGDVQRVSYLVNPQKEISPFVQKLTGIDNQMVRRAPALAKILPDLLPLLRGALFIAHNSRFDYTFWRNECQRAGVAFAALTLCSVQLSRKLYPQYHKHSLDSIIERNGLIVPSRHRAMADVDALAQFLQQALQERGAGAMRQWIEQLMQPCPLPENVATGVRKALSRVTDGCGVSIWRDAAGNVVNVWAHEQAFREIVPALRKQPAWIKSAVSFEFVPTVGSLHAAVLRLQTMQQLGCEDTAATGRYTVQFVSEQGRLQAKVRALSAGCLTQLPHGLFVYPKQAKRVLLAWAKKWHLCPTLLGILPTTLPANAPCPVVASGQTCSPACEQQDYALHDAAVQAAWHDLPVCDWGKWRRVKIVERDDVLAKQESFVAENGAVQWSDGHWYADKQILDIVKQKIKAKAVQGE